MIRDQDETASGQRQGDEHLNEGSPAAADDASADRPDGPGSRPRREDSAGPKTPAPDGAVTDDTKDAKALKDAKGAKDANGQKPERDTSHTLAPGERLETVASADRIEIESDEPLLSARVHRPSDLLRLVLGLLGIGLVLVIANFAHGTTAGLEQDIDKGTSRRRRC